LKAIVLAAGEGKRMGSLTRDIPKCLLPYQGESVLKRLIRQLKKTDVDEIIVVVGYKKELIMDEIGGVHFVVNDHFASDTNSYSLFLGLSEIDEGDDVVVYEADVLVEDAFVEYTVGTDFEHRSVWFVHDRFKPGQNGGVIYTDGLRNVLNLCILKEYDKQYDGWYKTTGVFRIAQEQVCLYHQFLKESVGCDQYFHMVWCEHMDVLPSVIGETKYFLYASFNTVDEYLMALQKRFDRPSEEKRVVLVAVDSLYPLEEHDVARLPLVQKGVIKQDCWRVPLRVEQEFNVVLDGHHSLALAQELDLNFVPVIYVDYDNVAVWSLRDEEGVDRRRVIGNALSNDLYPYKTIKHKFPEMVCDCRIALKKLKKGELRNV